MKTQFKTMVSIPVLLCTLCLLVVSVTSFNLIRKMMLNTYQQLIDCISANEQHLSQIP